MTSNHQNVGRDSCSAAFKAAGFNLNCSQAERVSVTMKVAAGEMTAEEILTWLKSRIIERQ